MRKTLCGMLIAAVFAFSNLSCKEDDAITYQPKTFVLVHGAWQAPYVWKQVQQGLEKGGNKIMVVELPAHGSDATPPQAVSIDAYSEKVLAVLNSVSGKVILVGHSMGGMVVSAVAEKAPGKIEKLVFIGAFVPANNQSLLDLAGQDHQSILGASIVPSADQLTLDIKHDSIIPVFCQDAQPAAQQQVVSQFRVEPAIPFTNKVVITDNGFGRVDKYYIHTLQDHAIGVDLQKAMAAAAHITKTYSVNSGHSPFLSKPDDVISILTEVSRK